MKVAYGIGWSFVCLKICFNIKEIQIFSNKEKLKEMYSENDPGNLRNQTMELFKLTKVSMPYHMWKQSRKNTR